MRGSGAKGLPQKRISRTITPVQEDKTCELYTEGHTYYGYQAGTNTSGSAVLLYGIDPDQVTRTYVLDLGEPRMLGSMGSTAFAYAGADAGIEWSHDGIRWYLVPGITRTEWPITYNPGTVGTGPMMTWQRPVPSARYWRVSVDNEETLSTATFACYCYDPRDPDVLVDANDTDYGDLDTSAFSVSHFPRQLNRGIHLDFGTRPDMWLVWQQGLDDWPSDKLFMLDRSRMAFTCASASFEYKFQITQLTTRGITLGRSLWGDNSATSDERGHPNHNTWGGSSLERYSYSTYPFKTNLSKGVSCCTIPAGATSAPHGLEVEPDFVLLANYGSSLNQTSSFALLVKVFPDWVITAGAIIGSSALLRTDTGMDADATHIYAPVSTGPRPALVFNNTSSGVGRAVGKYTGNGNVVGPIVSGLSFQPLFLVIYRVSLTSVNGGSWRILAGGQVYGFPSGGYTADYLNDVDITSDGFEVVTTDQRFNASGADYFYWAMGS